jgi:hypothetical protein
MTACDNCLALVQRTVIERKRHAHVLDALRPAALAEELPLRSIVLRGSSRRVANQLVHFDGGAHEFDQDPIAGHACRLCHADPRMADWASVGTRDDPVERVLFADGSSLDVGAGRAAVEEANGELPRV